MEELQPCPFCGGEAKYYSDCDMTQIQCAVCGATPSGWWDEPEDAAAAWNRRAAPENKPLELHFGGGKIGVSTCRPEKSETWNELLLWNPKMQQGVGNSIPIKDGTTTDDVEAYARLFFSNAESAQVVVDALNKIIDSYGGNKALTLDELRGMDGGWVWLIDTEHPEYDGWYNVRPFHDGSGGIELYGVDNNYYERAITAGSVKVCACKPEGSESHGTIN